MKEIKLLHVSIGINIAVGIWSLLTTIICVKFDHKNDQLTSEIKTLQDSITICNQTISQLEYDKLVLQEDTAKYSLQTDLAYWKHRAKSWQQLAEEHNLKLQPPPYVK